MKRFLGKDLSAFTSRRFTVRDFSRLRRFHQSTARGVVKPYLLADIGEGITECQIISWFVKPGDRVEQFDRICEVQSDKASVEITSRWEGIIKNLHYEMDDMATVGQPLLDIDTYETGEGGTPTGSTENEAVPEIIIADEIQQRAGSGPQLPEGPAAEASAAEASHASRPFKPKAQDIGTSLFIPSVRHMLKKLNIDADEIRGTGKNGRISKEDVQRYHSANSIPSSSIPINFRPTQASSSSPVTTAEDRYITLTPTQKAMLKTMTHSLEIPHFLYTHSVDITSINNLRKGLNAYSTSGNDSKLTSLPFILKAISHAFIQAPHLNAHLDTGSKPNKPQLLLKGQHNFGIAVATSQGLLVPVIKNVQAHSVSSLAAEIHRLSALAKEGMLAPDDFRDATFTVSNIGSIGGGVVSPIIVTPQVSILGIGRMQAVPRYHKDEKTGEETLARREEVVLSWSADHRVLDGATVAACAEAVGSLVCNWGLF